MMAGSSAESLTLKDAFTNWLSITALRHIPPDQKSVFRKLEKLELKIIRLEGHLEFNQACIRNKLLPTYTNIYIYTYTHNHIYKLTAIYIYIYI